MMLRLSLLQALTVAALWPTTPTMLAAPFVSVSDYPSVHKAVAQNPGRRIHVPSGRYILTNALVLRADHTELEGPGTLVQSNPETAVIEVQAHHVLLRDLTLTRGPGRTETDRDALVATEAAFLRVENLRIHDNHSSGASVRLQDCRFARVERCTIENYQRVVTDDRTTNPLYGYACRCLDGNGLIGRGGRGHQLLDNRIIEQRLLPTREVKERHRLGELVKGRQPTKFGELRREMERTRFAWNWHQGSAIVVTGPEDTEYTRVSGSYAIRIDRGQLASNPGIRDVLVQGNIVTDTG